MSDFFDALSYEVAQDVAILSRAMYEMREACQAILREHQATDLSALLSQIHSLVSAGKSEHPLYEHYLAYRILDEQRQALRRFIAFKLEKKEALAMEDASALIHLELRDALLAQPDMLTAPPIMKQDALILSLFNGIELTVHYAATDAYSLRWQLADGSSLGIDTAPGVAGIPPQHPQHLHLPDGRIVADFLTDFQKTPWENLCVLILALKEDAMLGQYEDI